MTWMILIGLASILFLFLVGSGIFWLLIQLGVIVQKAGEPPAQDSGGYSLDQGHDVGNRE
ncbi:MAG: hypothetical protein HC822_19515 [Oscillochloris sp.]|nr:hypothetical protein [Oscillochloris sp.]